MTISAFNKVGRIAFLIAIGFSVFTSAVFAQGTTLQKGSGYFEFSGHPALKGEKMRVFYHLPRENQSSMPVLFVMHGVLRNADTYRDNWVELAEKYQTIVIVPEFTQELFPKSRSYNYGNMFDANSKPVAREYWSFSLIDPIFDYVVKKLGNSNKKYDLFGHSAGSQFAHRFFMFMGDTKADRVIASNAGTYTMLDKNVDFPFGLKGTGLNIQNVKNMLQKKLVVHLGEEDSDPQHRYLNVSAEAMAQGKHRFERGMKFFKEAEALAKKYGVKFEWDLRIVPGVAHNNDEMAKDIAKYLFH